MIRWGMRADRSMARVVPRPHVRSSERLGCHLVVIALLMASPWRVPAAAAQAQVEPQPQVQVLLQSQVQPPVQGQVQRATDAIQIIDRLVAQRAARRAPLQLLIHDTPELTPAAYDIEAHWPMVLQADSMPSDSLYLEVQRAMRNGDFRTAAWYFAQLSTRYKRTSYAPQSMYWHAFALYRIGEVESLTTASNVLSQLTRQHSRWARISDAKILWTRVCGTMAQAGLNDRSCTALVYSQAQKTQVKSEECAHDDPSIALQVTAINALYRMDTTEAIPILKKVMKRRDKCSVRLRRQAVPIIGQMQAVSLLPFAIQVTRSDPDSVVRDQMANWVAANLQRGSMSSMELVKAYDEIPNQSVRRVAIAMLMKQEDQASINKLIAIASDVNDPLRGHVISHLASSNNPNVARALVRILDK